MRKIIIGVFTLYCIITFVLKASEIYSIIEPVESDVCLTNDSCIYIKHSTYIEWQECPYCEGNGYIEEKTECSCRAIGGYGCIKCDYNGIIETRNACDKCAGSGQIKVNN